MNYGHLNTHVVERWRELHLDVSFWKFQDCKWRDQRGEFNKIRFFFESLIYLQFPFSTSRPLHLESCLLADFINMNNRRLIAAVILFLQNMNCILCSLKVMLMLNCSFSLIIQLKFQIQYIQYNEHNPRSQFLNVTVMWFNFVLGSPPYTYRTASWAPTQTASMTRWELLLWKYCLRVLIF